MEEQADRFKLLITILIAFVTVFGAFVVWRSAVASNAAGDAEQQGILETLTHEELLAAHETSLYTDLQYFARYSQHRDLAAAMQAEEAAARARGETPLANDLAREATLHDDLATTLDDFFDTSYLLPDGTFDAERYLADLAQADARFNTLAPEERFAGADALRAKMRQLVRLIVLLTVVLFLYTLAQMIEGRWRYPAAVLGTVLFLTTVVWFVIIERTV